MIVEDGDEESNSDDADEHDLEEQGGDLGTEECDKLDEQMWASDDDEPLKVTAGCSSSSSSALCVFVSYILVPAVPVSA